MSDNGEEIWDAESWEETDPTERMHAIEPTRTMPQTEGMPHTQHHIEYRGGRVDKPIKSRESHARYLMIGAGVVSVVVCSLLVMSQHGDRIPRTTVADTDEEGGCRYPDMYNGGDDTRFLQEYLNSHRIEYGDNAGQFYYTGPIDGIYGTKTIQAVFHLQADMAENGIYPDDKVDGKAMAETCKALGDDFYDNGN